MDYGIKIDIFRIIKALLKKWVLITFAAVVGFAIGLLLTLRAGSNYYYAYTTIYNVGYASSSSSSTSDSTTALKTYSDLVSSRKVCDRAAIILGDNSYSGSVLQGITNATYSSSSAIITISAGSSNAVDAVRVANAMADAFVIEVRNLTGESTVQILDEAQTAYLSYDDNADRWKKRIVFAFGAAFVVCAVIVLKEVFSNKIYHIEDCTLDGQLEVLGVIPDKDIE